MTPPPHLLLLTPALMLLLLPHHGLRHRHTYPDAPPPLLGGEPAGLGVGGLLLRGAAEPGVGIGHVAQAVAMPVPTHLVGLLPPAGLHPEMGFRSCSVGQGLL